MENNYTSQEEPQEQKQPVVNNAETSEESALGVTESHNSETDRGEEQKITPSVTETADVQDKDEDNGAVSPAASKSEQDDNQSVSDDGPKIPENSADSAVEGNSSLSVFCSAAGFWAGPLYSFG